MVKTRRVWLGGGRKDELESQRLSDGPSKKDEDWDDEEGDLNGRSDGDREGEVDPEVKEKTRVSGGLKDEMRTERTLTYP